MKRIFRYQITKEDTPTTISVYLKSMGYSQPVIRHLKRTKEGILKNGIWARVNEPLLAQDTLIIRLIEEEGSFIEPTEMPLDIIYEDEDIMVINKAANIAIHPSQGHYHSTLANGLAFYFKQQGESFVYRCMNRLDRDTTGLLIIAKHMLSAAILSSMIAKREIHRKYLAIAEGIVPECGTITAPIARVCNSTIERCVQENGEFARTHFKRIAYKNGYSLVSLQLDTGRTHQIRVHMKYIGHPLPGDFLYNPDYSIMQRQALHSHCLEFTHPITGMPLTFTVPLPEDMQWVL